MKAWKLPPRIKVYEALGTIADGRIFVERNNAKVKSSTGEKTYVVQYDPQKHAIMANDNGSYWQGYLGYPAITLLLRTEVISVDQHSAALLGGICWKKVNTQFHNDFTKTEKYVLKLCEKRGGSKSEMISIVDDVLLQIERLHLIMLGKRLRPPAES